MDARLTRRIRIQTAQRHTLMMVSMMMIMLLLLLLGVLGVLRPQHSRIRMTWQSHAILFAAAT